MANSKSRIKGVIDSIARDISQYQMNTEYKQYKDVLYDNPRNEKIKILFYFKYKIKRIIEKIAFAADQKLEKKGKQVYLIYTPRPGHYEDSYYQKSILGLKIDEKTREKAIERISHKISSDGKASYSKVKRLTQFMPEVHFTEDCCILKKEMENSNNNIKPFNRYHAIGINFLKCSVTGKDNQKQFEVVLEHPYIDMLHKSLDKTIFEVYPIEIQLEPCVKCLEATNYKGYNKATEEERESIIRNFNFIWLVKTLKRNRNKVTIINKKPNKDQTEDVFSTVEKNYYTEDWRVTSRDIRLKRHYTCEECGVNLGKLEKENRKYYKIGLEQSIARNLIDEINNGYLIDCHHIDRDKNNNNENNIQVLCKLCHSEQPGHEAMKKDKKYSEWVREIEGRRKEQQQEEAEVEKEQLREQ